MAIKTEQVRQVLERPARSAPACSDLLLVTDREGRYRGAVELVMRRSLAWWLNPLSSTATTATPS
jgi:hypothetical protein